MKHLINVDVYNGLIRFDTLSLSKETRPYFLNVYDHVGRIIEMIENTRELLNTALKANFSSIFISQNDASKKIVDWVVIIAILTMIAGFYGINFKFMPEVGVRVLLHFGGYRGRLYASSFLFQASDWL